MQSAIADQTPALAPIHLEIFVPCPPDRAFDYYTRDIGRWWPLASHSLGGPDAAGVRFEGREGGRLVETLRNGDERTWGTVTTWQPARHVAFTWHLDRDPATAQQVDVRFEPATGGTRVSLTHGGWEHRDDGASARENYVGGWKFVLGERYGGYCAAAVVPASDGN